VRAGLSFNLKYFRLVPAGDGARRIGKIRDMIEILVVDDDALMRGLLAEWLSEAGYGVRQAQTGTAALQMLRNRPAGVLITDMDMPGRDGAQTLGEARRMLPGLAVIAISGGACNGRQNWAATALKLGAAKTLAKPFERQDLLAAVEEVVPRNTSGSVRA
jgi:DNA-binding NtrC family response regulator